MNFKHIMLISLLLVILTIGAVSAADNVTSDNLAAGEDLNLEFSIDSNDTDENMGAENTDILSDTPGTLTELNSAIAGAGAELTLTKDYIRSEGDPEDIIIDKKITIDGAGHTIDANNTQDLFFLQANEIVLKNMKIMNGKNYMRGGVGVYALNSANSALINCTFINCYGSGTNGGAVSWINSPNGIIANCTFIGCTASLNAGGSLGIESANTIVSNCSFINSSADYEGGGAIYCNGENTTIEGSTFINSATYEGNGRSIKADAGNVIIINCKFERDAQRFPEEILGGTIINCTFNGNLYDGSAEDSFKHLQQLITSSASEVNLTHDYTFSILDAGAITIDKSITINGMGHTIDAKKLTQILIISSNGVTLKNIRFINAYGDMVNGGAIICNGANLTVSNCTFINCTISYYGYGGSICCQGDNTTIENSTFINSSAEADRAISINGNNAVIKNSLFEDKNTQNFYNEVSRGTIINCTFNGNLIDENTQNSFRKLKSLITAATTELNLTEDYINLNYDSVALTISKAITIDGMGHTIDCNNTNRAFQISSANVTLKNIKFKNGFTEMSGGAVIYIASGENCIITNCSFEDSNVYYDQGGALYVASNNALVANCSFINCYSYDKGAAIYWSGNDGRVYNCSFVKCRPDYKGTVTWQGSNGVIANSNFINCSGSSYAGGVFWEGDNGSLLNTNFTNSGSHTAGAVFWEGDNGLITNCTFTNSESDTNGGAIYWANKTGSIENSTFNKFKSGEAHAIYVENDIVSISNSKFTDNRYSTFNEIITGGNITNCTLNENGVKIVDLDVSIASNITGPYYIGDSSIFTVTVTNNGPSGANGAFVTINYSNLLSIKSRNTLKGSTGYGNGTGELIWTIGSLSADETATLTITVQAMQTGNATLIASVDSAVNDTNTMNNAAIENIAVLGNPTILTIDTNITGSSVTLTFTITPSEATGNISITVDGTNYVLNPVNGTSTLNRNFTAGEYLVLATYLGDANYMPASTNDTFTVPGIAGNTLTDLKNLIDAAGPTLTLTDDFTYSTGDSNHITIDKTITIDGAGHTIDCRKEEMTFIIESGNVILKNIKFANGNGYITYMSGVINWRGANGIVSDCSFENCSANDVFESNTWYNLVGGAIAWNAGNGTISGCNFTNCSAGSGGAIQGEKINVDNCKFIDCSSQSAGGAIDSGGQNTVFANCSFINCSAEGSGGAIYLHGKDSTISGCSFTNCSALGEGGAIELMANNEKVYDCTFDNCSANYKGGGAIYDGGDSIDIYNSTFINCAMQNTGNALYFYGSYGQVRNSKFKSTFNDSRFIYSQNYVMDVSNCEFENPNLSQLDEVQYKGNLINCTLNGNAPIKTIDLSLVINSNVTICDLGDMIEITVAASNAGPDDATGAYVTLDCPISLSIKSQDTIKGSTGYGNGTGGLIWTIGNLTSGETATLTITVQAIQTGNMTVIGTVSANENDAYAANNMASTQITSLVKESTLTIDANITGNNVTLTFTIPEDATGNITCHIGGMEYVLNPVNGKYTLTNEFEPGTYQVTATYSGDANYMAANNETTFTVIATNTFTYLQMLIDEAGQTLTLTNDFIYSTGDSGQITINKTITIDGKGHTIDANHQSRIFTITAEEVILKNINFKNGREAANGGSIYWRGNSGRLANCSFTDSASDANGGAIYWEGADGKVEDSRFTDCSALQDGGAIYWSGSNGTVSNSAFTNKNESKAAVYATSNGVEIINSNFDRKSAVEGGTMKQCTYDEVEAKNATEITLTAHNIEIGDSQIIEATLAGDATGNVTFEVYKNSALVKTSSAAITGGSASIVIPNLAIGSYRVEAIYPGDERYNETSKSTTFKVMPKVTISQGVSVGSKANIYIDFGEDITDSLIVKIDGKTFGVTDIEEGVVNYTFSTAKLKEGNREVTFDYEGDLFDKTLISQESYNMYLIPEEIPIPEEIKSTDDGVVTLEFPINATGTLTVYIDGEAQEILDVGKELKEFLAQSNKTVEEIVVGLLKIDLSKYKGNVTVTFAYSGDENYQAFEKEANATIYVNTAIIQASNANVLYSAGPTYTIKVYSDKNALAKSGKVVIKANNKAFKTLTIKNGIASFKVTQVPGTYKLTISALGKTKTTTLTVKHVVTLKTVTVKRSAKKLILTATLSKVNKKYLKSKKVTFKFNGKTYTTKTNKKGVAKVTIKSSVLKKLKVGKKVTYQATYLKDTVKKTAKIKK